MTQNPWNKFEYSVVESIVKYGRDAGKTKYVEVRHTNPINDVYGVRTELLDTSTNLTKKILRRPIVRFFGSSHFTYPIDASIDLTDEKYQVMVVWTDGGYNGKHVLKPIDTIQFRYCQQDLDRLKLIQDTIRVGDFVKCSGTRSGDWNKVDNIKGDIIFGPKYTRPEEGYMRYASSRNHISKVTHIVRNGERIC